MSGNPGWRMLQRVDIKALFHALDRNEGTVEIPAHQELTSSLLHCLRSPACTQQVPTVLADDRWTRVCSTAPIHSWAQALLGEGIEAAVESPAHSSRPIVEMIRALGDQDRACLHRLCIWLAPSLYTVEEDRDQGNIIFAGTDPLDREFVSFSTEAAATDNSHSCRRIDANPQKRNCLDRRRDRPQRRYC